jgi:hypothetical protein
VSVESLKLVRRQKPSRRLDFEPPIRCHCGADNLTIIDHRAPWCCLTASPFWRYEVTCDTCLQCDCGGYQNRREILAAYERRVLPPLFIPLCAGPFDEFKAGTKVEEYRPEGARWNAEVCRIGRRVVLSRGYGKKDRLQGVIVGYRQIWSREVPNWSTYYPNREGRVAAIKIEVEGKV